MPNAVLDAARVKRDAIQQEMEEIVGTIGARDDKEPTDDEASRITDLGAKRVKKDQLIKDLEAEEARSEKAASAAAEQAQAEQRAAVVTAEPMTYGQDGPNSYVRDLAQIAVSGLDPSYRSRAIQAEQRLARHDKEVEVESRSNAHLSKTLSDMRREMNWEQRVNPNTTDGTGGEFVPPTWFVDQYVPLARAGRTVANRMQHRPLPGGTDQINLPKILTGTTAAIQAAQADNVSSTDLTTSTVTAQVNTIAGQQDVSIQLLDQSPINMDQVIFDDLSADYDLKLDKQVIGGTGLNGQHLGIFGQTAATANSATSLNTDASKMNAVTCASVIFSTGATTSFTQVRSILNGVTNIQTLRLRAPSAMYAHPRRINSWQFATDSPTATTFDGGRPVFVRYGAFNSFGTSSNLNPEGVVGELLGVPVVSDPNIPIVCSTGAITAGTGDMIGLVVEDDMILWEGNLRMRVLPEVLSGKLQVRIQIYAYSAFMPNRYPGGTTLVTGTTGLAAASY